MFSGGALERMSIFALGIMPLHFCIDYHLQLMTAGEPHPGAVKKEGGVRASQDCPVHRYLTLVLAFISGRWHVGRSGQGQECRFQQPVSASTVPGR